MSVMTAPVPTSQRQKESELAALAEALGHPARVRIVRLLLKRDACYCGEIVEELPLAQATISQHLRVLKVAGMIRGEIDGPRICYCADREPPCISSWAGFCARRSCPIEDRCEGN